nr:stage II sporulation protein R [uncultured Merdimonas sp.]
MKERVCIIAAACIALAATLFISSQRAEEVEAKVGKTQQELAEEVFRFHIVANSDSSKDQALKLMVRDAVLAEMKSDLPEEKAEDVREAESWARDHLEEIEETARDVVRQEGYTYGARAEVTTCEFPDKRYGDLLFPAGEYRALKISLGKAAGQNWWCVLYPNLCFRDSVCAVVDEEGKEELEEALTAEEYEMITASTKFKIKWFFLGDSKDD